jgi:hypothetical protein
MIASKVRLLTALERGAMLNVFNDKKEQLLARLLEYPLRINDVSMLREKMEVQKQLDGIEMLIDQMKKRFVFAWITRRRYTLANLRDGLEITR